eukprot:1676103-Pyramimonas_sp.AAC.1
MEMGNACTCMFCSGGRAENSYSDVGSLRVRPQAEGYGAREECQGGVAELELAPALHVHLVVCAVADLAAVVGGRLPMPSGGSRGRAQGGVSQEGEVVAVRLRESFEL